MLNNIISHLQTYEVIGLKMWRCPQVIILRVFHLFKTKVLWRSLEVTPGDVVDRPVWAPTYYMVGACLGYLRRMPEDLVVTINPATLSPRGVMLRLCLGFAEADVLIFDERGREVSWDLPSRPGRTWVYPARPDLAMFFPRLVPIEAGEKLVRKGWAYQPAGLLPPGGGGTFEDGLEALWKEVEFWEERGIPPTRSWERIKPHFRCLSPTR